MCATNREQLQYLHVQSTTQERVNSKPCIVYISCMMMFACVTDAVDRIKAIIGGEVTNKQSTSQVSKLWVVARLTGQPN